MRYLYFIVNKQSRNSKEVFKKLLILLPKYKIKYKFLITESIDQLDTLLSQLKNKIQRQDLFVVVGGDGSLNQFINFYSKHHFRNSIAYIPAGSGNDFARSYEIPFDTEEALLHLLEVKAEQELSIISARNKEKKVFAVNSIGFGIDALVGHLIESKGKKERLGASAYFMGIFSAFRKQEKFPITLTIKNQSYHFDHVQLALVANNPFFGGGISIVPKASGKDDWLEILVVDNVSAKDLLTILPRLLMNQSHLAHPKMHSFQAKEMNLTIHSKQYAQKDGEVFQEDSYHYHFQTKKIPFWI